MCRGGWRGPLRREHGPTRLRCGEGIKCGVAGRCPHLEEVVMQVFDVFTHVGHACTLFKMVLVLHFARIKERPEKSQHREVSTVPMMECSVVSYALGRARCFLSRCIFVRFREVDGTQATLKTVCLQLEFALNFSSSEPTVVAAILRPQVSKRPFSEGNGTPKGGVHFHVELFWSGFKSKRERPMQQSSQMDLLPRMSLAKNASLDNIPATWHQAQGSRIRQRLWRHLALTAKSSIICKDLRPSACKECEGARTLLVTRRTQGTHTKKKDAPTDREGTKRGCSTPLHTLQSHCAPFFPFVVSVRPCSLGAAACCTTR